MNRPDDRVLLEHAAGVTSVRPRYVAEVSPDPAAGLVRVVMAHGSRFEVLPADGEALAETWGRLCQLLEMWPPEECEQRQSAAAPEPIPCQHCEDIATVRISSGTLLLWVVCEPCGAKLIREHAITITPLRSSLDTYNPQVGT